MLKALTVGLILVGVVPRSTEPNPRRTPQSRTHYEQTEDGRFRGGRFNFYRNDSCGISFSYPTGWETVSDLEGKAAGHCNLYLRPTDWDLVVARSEFDLPDHQIVIYVAPRPWAETLKERGFELRDGKWIYRPGTIFSQEPGAISGPDWRGLEISDQAKRMFKGDKGGSTVDHLSTIILGNGTRSAQISAAVPDVDDYVFYSVARSFQFYPVSAGK
jgi:hypothetical protein